MRKMWKTVAPYIAQESEHKFMVKIERRTFKVFKCGFTSLVEAEAFRDEQLKLCPPSEKGQRNRILSK